MKINPNGFREYDARWVFEKDIDLEGITDLGRGLGTQIIKHTKIDINRIVYMGDDIPDLEVMKNVGLSCCPSDAVPEIKDISSYISYKKGGKGCVRDIIEQTLRVQNKWNNNFN